MNDNENLPIEAEIVSIRATAEEAKKLNKSLLAKTTIVRQHFAGRILETGEIEWYV